MNAVPVVVSGSFAYLRLTASYSPELIRQPHRCFRGGPSSPADCRVWDRREPSPLQPRWRLFAVGSTKARRSIQQLGIDRCLWRRFNRDHLERAAVRLGASMRGTLRDDKEVARFHLHFLIAEPDRSVAFEDVLHLIGIVMQMLGCIAVLYGEGHAVSGGERPGAQPGARSQTKRVSVHFGHMYNLCCEVFGSQPTLARPQRSGAQAEPATSPWN
jgi:hypothetical protein